MVIRTATVPDIDFLVEAIIQADKSGTEVSSYCRIFGLSEEELRKSLSQIVPENIGGFEISLDSFKIAEIGYKPVGAVASWIEGAAGIASGIRKLSAFSLVFPRRHMEIAKGNLALISELSIDRMAGTLQIESVYTDSYYRGQGISEKLISCQIDEFKLIHPEIETVQIQVMGENYFAIQAYQRMGFEITYVKTSDIPDITRLMPGRTKLMLEKKISKS
jgi:ribosomal protein S18 acetylase RimI-like enzyme